jgi:hypothetical protein
MREKRESGRPKKEKGGGEMSEKRRNATDRESDIN